VSAIVAVIAVALLAFDFLTYIIPRLDRGFSKSTGYYVGCIRGDIFDVCRARASYLRVLVFVAAVASTWLFWVRIYSRVFKGKW